ncbi:MAG: XdhC family protein [Planctomycetota bacterium]
MLELLDEIVTRTAAGEVVGVCMVASTRGSTPQKAGALMLVLESGQTLGTLGGGCVEAEVRTRAQELMHRRESKTLEFKLDGDVGSGWDDGLVCGGTMRIAVETVTEAAVFRSVAEAVKRAEPATLTVVDAEHTFEPRPSLVIAGAGHVGQALAAIAGPAGFDVTVVDDRPGCASEQRFPDATRIVGDIECELRGLPIHANTFVVIVTRGHRHDADALAAVVDKPAKYVGLIGSKRKILTILRQLHGNGVDADTLAKVHAPIGLSIGAITPEEIAISIAAELVAIRRAPTDIGRPLKLDPKLATR